MRFLDGYPGRYVVLARRSGARWFIAGINGETTDREVTLNLMDLAGSTSVTLITDGADALGFGRTDVTVPQNGQLRVTLRAHGGFVIVTAPADTAASRSATQPRQ
jgi:alpha-glucosidase